MSATRLSRSERLPLDLPMRGSALAQGPLHEQLGHMLATQAHGREGMEAVQWGMLSKSPTYRVQSISQFSSKAWDRNSSRADQAQGVIRQATYT